MKNRITVIGSSNVDFIMKAPQLPQVGETVTDCIFQQTFGGKGANQAVAAARAGGGVTFVTCLGEDLYAPILMKSLKKDGIDVSKIQKFKDMNTGSALVMFDGSGENYLTVSPGANYKLTPKIVKECEKIISGSAMILLQMEIPLESNLKVLDIASRHGVPVLYNYAPIRDASIKVTGKMSGLVVNEVEAAALLGIKNVADGKEGKAAESLLKKGPSFVIITLGSKGAVIASEDGIRQVPAFKVKPVDTTAAGDTFCGALAVGLVEGMELDEAVRFASAASAISVTRMGAQPSIPFRREIEKFIRSRGGK
ncbi:MAG TPA: ribokinase [Lentisphaeria bacterium]|nr:ribokinase [Lentisphaeria bacterium]